MGHYLKTENIINGGAHMENDLFKKMKFFRPDEARIEKLHKNPDKWLKFLDKTADQLSSEWNTLQIDSNADWCKDVTADTLSTAYHLAYLWKNEKEQRLSLQSKLDRLETENEKLKNRS